MALALCAAAVFWAPSSPQIDLDSIRMTAGEQDSEQVDLMALAEPVTDRPLFDSTRRPSHTETPAVQSPTPMPSRQPVLAGILAGKNGKIALLRFAGASQTEAVNQGSSVRGWEVLEIGAASVTIRSAEGESHILPIGR
jgi:hypothetical protein